MGTANPLVVLVGPPGAGKTSVGTVLAERLGVWLTDSDQLIADRYGKTCGEVFAELTEPGFREVEVPAVAHAIAQGGVVSLGGGAVTAEANRELLAHVSAHGTLVVWLDVDAQEAVARTAPEGTRPILDAVTDTDPVAHYQQLLDRRRGWYEEVSGLHLMTTGHTTAELAGSILESLADE